MVNLQKIDYLYEFSTINFPYKKQLIQHDEQGLFEMLDTNPQDAAR